MNTYNFSIYGDGDNWGYKVIATDKNDTSKQTVVEDSGAVYELREDVVTLGKNAVKVHEYKDWKATVKDDPEYQEFRNRYNSAID
jgi:hypothetical protein